MQQFNSAFQITKDSNSALDIVLYNNPDLRGDLNRLRPVDAQISYAEIAKKANENEYERYLYEEKKFQTVKAATNSTDAPGQGNTLQTTVQQSIMFRVDNYNAKLNKRCAVA